MLECSREAAEDGHKKQEYEERQICADAGNTVDEAQQSHEAEEEGERCCKLRLDETLWRSDGIFRVCGIRAIAWNECRAKGEPERTFTIAVSIPRVAAVDSCVGKIS